MGRLSRWGCQPANSEIAVWGGAIVVELKVGSAERQGLPRHSLSRQKGTGHLLVEQAQQWQQDVVGNLVLSACQGHRHMEA